MMLSFEVQKQLIDIVKSDRLLSVYADITALFVNMFLTDLRTAVR